MPEPPNISPSPPNNKARSTQNHHPSHPTLTKNATTATRSKTNGQLVTNTHTRLCAVPGTPFLCTPEPHTPILWQRFQLFRFFRPNHTQICCLRSLLSHPRHRLQRPAVRRYPPASRQRKSEARKASRTQRTCRGVERWEEYSHPWWASIGAPQGQTRHANNSGGRGRQHKRPLRKHAKFMHH